MWWREFTGRSSRKEGYWLTESCVACMKNAWIEIAGKAEGDIGRKFYKLAFHAGWFNPILLAYINNKKKKG